MYSTNKYDVFMTCAREDKEQAKYIAKKLKTFGLSSWYEPPAPDAIDSEIPEILLTISSFAFICGENGSKSYTQEQIWPLVRQALDKRKHDVQVILILLPDIVDSCFIASSLDLRDYVVVKFNNTLDDTAAITKFVQAIRGLNPDGEPLFQDREFREVTRQRAISTLADNGSRFTFPLPSIAFYKQAESEDAVSNFWKAKVFSTNGGLKHSIQLGGKKERMTSLLPYESTANSEQEMQLSFDIKKCDVKLIVGLIQNILLQRSRSSSHIAASTLRYLQAAHYDDFKNSVKSFLDRPMNNTDSWKKYLLDKCKTPNVLAYRDHKENVTSKEALNWITSKDAHLYLLAKSKESCLLIARVNTGNKRFRAGWVQIGASKPQYNIFMINQDVKGDALVDDILHELDHLIENFSNEERNAMSFKNQTQTVIADSKLENYRQDNPNQTPLVLFASAQQHVDPTEKDIVARWVAKDLPLSTGAGLFLDAGSSTWALWKEILNEIKNNKMTNLYAVTNNMLVLREWIDALNTIPALLGTNVQIAGELPDASHLAYYGPALQRQLTSSALRLSGIYVGAFGVEFDEIGGIRIGYHAGDLERHCKELLFSCPCKGARVILATPQKIGNPGGQVVDILSMEGLDTKAPVYLVTAEPHPDNKEEQERFDLAKRTLNGEPLRRKILDKGLEFHWVIVDRNNNGIPKAKEHIEIIP